MDGPSSNLPPLREGRYELREPLGKGGMASVFLAYDNELATHRAVKIVTYQATEEDPRRRRLRNEAQAMAQLCHPHVVQVFDIGSEGPVDYVVMELAPGGSLADQLEQHGPMPVKVAVGWALDVLSALSAAHAAGIVHRDVKPQNVLVDALGRAMLADFGIALITDDDVRRTRTGIAMGSLAYMPPEQRLDAARVTHRADLYAVGSTLYRLLTHEGAVDLFLADEDSPRWAGVDPELAAVLRKAVASEPAHRYSSATAFAEALSAWAPLGDRPFSDTVIPAWTIDEPAGAYVPTAGPEQALRNRRRPAGLLVAGAAVAILLGGIGAWSLTTGSSVGAADPEPVTASVPEEEPLAEPEAPPQVSAAGKGPALQAPQLVEPVRPRPVAPPQPEQPANEDLPVPLGTWLMNNGGVQLTVELRGTPATLRGTVTSRMSKGARLEQHPVVGRYNASDRFLTLTETDTGVRYHLTLKQDEGSGMGTVKYNGVEKRLVLSRP